MKADGGTEARGRDIVVARFRTQSEGEVQAILARKTFEPIPTPGDFRGASPDLDAILRRGAGRVFAFIVLSAPATSTGKSPRSFVWPAYVAGTSAPTGSSLSEVKLLHVRGSPPHAEKFQALSPGKDIHRKTIRRPSCSLLPTDIVLV